MVSAYAGLRPRKDFEFIKSRDNFFQKNHPTRSQLIVVFTRPTFTNNASIEKSTAKSGDSRIVSFSVFVALDECTIAFVYSSANVILTGSPSSSCFDTYGLVKTALESLKTAFKKSNCRSERVSGSPSARLIGRTLRVVLAGAGLVRPDTAAAMVEGKFPGNYQSAFYLIFNASDGDDERV